MSTAIADAPTTSGPSDPVTEAFHGLMDHAERIKNDQPQRLSEAMSPGDTFAQGDIALIKIGDTLSPAQLEKLRKIEFRAKLVPGDTQGAQHCLASSRGITLFECKNGNPLRGPVILATEEFTVTHPEHGHLIVPPGAYASVFQRDHAEELRRVMD